MEIVEVSTPVVAGKPFFYTALQLEDYDCLVSGPAGPDKHKVIAEIYLYHGVIRATIIHAYVPYLT